MNKKEVIISVVIPHRNNVRQLQRGINAVALQSISRAQICIIVVDNGSTTKIPIEVQESVDQWLSYDKTLNPYICRNIGIRASNTQYVALLDSTCVPRPKWLENGINKLNCGARVVAGAFDISYDVSDLYSMNYALSHLNNAQSVKHKAPVVAGNLFFHKKVIETVGYFPEHSRSGGDIEWTRRIWSSGNTIAYSQEAMVRIQAKSKAEVLTAENRFGRGSYLQSKDKSMAHHVKMILYHLLPDKPSRITRRISYQNDPKPFQKRFWTMWWITWRTNLIFLRGYLSGMLSTRQ